MIVARISWDLINLKKVKYFKEINVWSVLKSKVLSKKGFKNLQVKAEAYLEHKRASKTELFVNIVNGLLLLQ